MANRVVIDAGHGGTDPGAVNGTRLEKDDNLRMALAIGNFLRNCGVNVTYTRSTDVFIPLLERSRISNRVNADLFVSVHRNSSTNSAANGVENWIHNNATPRTASAAKMVLDRVVAVGVQNNRGLLRGNFSVLRNTDAPSMLMEYGFISNDEDNRLFDVNFDDYARATAGGILQFLNIRCPGVNVPTPPIQPPTHTGDKVIRNIQQTLNSRYNAGLTVDGVFGPLSRRALIRAYQIELNQMFNAGLATDGIWGPATRAASRQVRLGDRNDLVWILQSALYGNGYPVNPDSIFGPQTEAQVRSFQHANGLPVDGVAGPDTFERLFQWR